MIMINWSNVAKHLAEEVMEWHLDRSRFWLDLSDLTQMHEIAWRPHEKWSHVGLVIDKLGEQGLRYSGFADIYGEEPSAQGYELSDLCRCAELGITTPQEAISYSAALITKYVEVEIGRRTIGEVPKQLSSQEREEIASGARLIRSMERANPNSQDEKDLLRAWHVLRYEKTINNSKGL